jgi:hypothetical protein
VEKVRITLYIKELDVWKEFYFSREKRFVEEVLKLIQGYGKAVSLSVFNIRGDLIYDENKNTNRSSYWTVASKLLDGL